MAQTKIKCAHCGKKAYRENGHINRAKRSGLRVFCSRVCFGLDRRTELSKAELVKRKRLYDHDYRKRDPEALKVRKAAYHQQTYDPTKAARDRKRRMPYHVEYCRRPEYKAWKAAYDAKLRASEYGPYAEAWMLLMDLNKEILSRMSKQEIYQANGTNCKTQRRRREYESTFGRQHESSIVGHAQRDQER